MRRKLHHTNYDGRLRLYTWYKRIPRGNCWPYAWMEEVIWCTQASSVAKIYPSYLALIELFAQEHTLDFAKHFSSSHLWYVRAPFYVNVSRIVEIVEAASTLDVLNNHLIDERAL